MSPTVSAMPTTAHKGVTLNVKLDVIRYILYDLVGYFLDLGRLKNLFHIN